MLAYGVDDVAHSIHLASRGKWLPDTVRKWGPIKRLTAQRALQKAQQEGMRNQAWWISGHHPKPTFQETMRDRGLRPALSQSAGRGARGVGKGMANLGKGLLRSAPMLALQLAPIVWDAYQQHKAQQTSSAQHGRFGAPQDHAQSYNFEDEGKRKPKSKRKKNTSSRKS